MRRQMNHLPQTRAQHAHLQQNTMSRHMAEQRAAPQQQQRATALAMLQQRATQERQEPVSQIRATVGKDGDVTLHLLAQL